MCVRTGKLIWLLLLCAGCTPVSQLPALDKKEVEAEQRLEQVAQMRSYFAELHRLDNVAFKLRVANRAFCRQRVAAQIGLFAATAQSLPRRFHAFAGEAVGVGWTRPQVISVADRSPAAQAGIREHDEIIALNGELIAARGTDTWMTAWLRRNGEAPVTVTLRRDGQDVTVSVTPVTGCSIPISYVVADEANAYTDDKKIVINSGIVALAKTDAQLASVIGHEMAHVWLRHLSKRMGNMVLGTIAGAAVDGTFLLGTVSTGGVFTREFQKAGLRAYSVAFEREADYVGAYFAARAGYELAGVEDIWRAMGQTHPDSLRFARSHPLAPVRFVQMKHVAEEIAEKQRKHLPLVPDVKEPEPAPADESGTLASAAH
jgi:hypothetical protein